jgi:hypothetical protein
MKKFTKQLLFTLSAITIIGVGGVLIYGATAGGGLKINPILGHDLDLNGLYYGQAATSTVHDITTQDISVSAWVKVDVDMSGYQAIVSKRGATESYYYFAVDTTAYGGAMYLLVKDGTDSYTIRGTTDLRDNKWHYVSAIIDKSDATQSKVFLDGIDNTLSRSGTLANVDSLTNTVVFNVGARNGGTPFDGQIRDVKLYYAAGDHWSDAQVLYQAQHPFDYTSNAGTLTDYWRLDEGSGTTLYGKVNNLTLSNVLAWTTQPKIKMVNQQNATTTSNNPVGWWKFDEGTGQYVYDVSGNGNTGTLGTSTSAEPADPTWTTGKLGKGLSFDGVNDYVGSFGSSISPVGSRTVSVWFKTLNTTRGGLVGNRPFADSHGFVFTVNKDVAGNLSYFHTGGSVLDVAAGITTGVWYHAVAAYDVPSATVKLYLNGLLIGTGTSFSAEAASEFNGIIGDESDRKNHPFNGLIDDVRIYNRALTAGEVAQMYNSTKDGYLGNIKVSTGLVGYWKLDDNNALTSVIDYSGKGNTGTAYNWGVVTSTSVMSTSTAMIGKAFGFDGVNYYVSVPDPANGILDFGTGNFTVSSWIKTESSATIYEDNFLAKLGTNAPGYPGWQLAVLNSKLYIGLDDDTGWTVNLSNKTVNDNVWHHIVLVRTGGTGTIYIDGVLDKSFAGRSGNFDNNQPVYMGGLYNFGSQERSFPGIVDEVKIWNYARSATEIQQDYIRGTMGRSD